MSTITVVRKGNQIALAADSLCSANYYRREGADYIVNHQKIFPIGESLLALAGPASAKLALEDYFSGLDELPQFSSVAEIYRAWNCLHLALKNDYFLCPKEDADDAFESTRIDVLIANTHGIFGVSTHRSVQEFSKFFAFGSGDDYALGALFSLYNEPGYDAEQIARAGVAAAIEFSSNSGAPVLSQTLALK